MREDSIRTTCQECDSTRATHLCEDCGGVLCTDCLESKTSQYIVCNECHADLGIPDPGQKIEDCPECESENLGKGRRVEERCPECHSTRIIRIDEKRKKLAQKLRSSIKGLHYGHTKLREFNSQLTSAKRLLVSLRMANFLHYKWLEDNIESLQEETVALKNRVMNQAERVARRIAAETKGLIDYTKWSTNQFPFIEGITHRVSQIGEHYKENVDDALRTAKAALDDIDRQLEGLDYYRKRFVGFYEVAELSVNELPVSALPDIKITNCDFLRTDKATGTLYITNRRLVFIAETGIVRKKMEIIFDFPLLYLTSIEEDGRFRKRLILGMKQGDIKIACNEQTQKVLPDYIEIAKKFDRYQQTNMQRVRKIEQRDANISDVRIKIEELVFSLLDIREDKRLRSDAPRPTRTGRGYDVYQTDPNHSKPYNVRHDSSMIYGSRRINSYPSSPGPRRNETALQREYYELEEALKQTKDLFRAGRIVPEDFIRRYKRLMRDSYDTRQEIENFRSKLRNPDWRY